MYTLRQFLDSDLSLVIYDGDLELFSSRASNLEPLVAFMEKDVPAGNALVVFDRYVGRAAALLISGLKPQKVYTGVISDGGVLVFEEAGIVFEARERAKFLMGVASEDMCRWEKLAQGKSADELLVELKKTRER